MKIHESLTLEVLEAACNSVESVGFCIACGAEHWSIEPDACRYECEECEKHTVYGAEELLYLA
jgi:hypothetical protein